MGGVSSRKSPLNRRFSRWEHEQAINLSMPLRPRWLVKEPLIAQDWLAILHAYRAFIVQVRLIVAGARARAGYLPEFDPTPAEEGGSP